MDGPPGVSDSDTATDSLRVVLSQRFSLDRGVACPSFDRVQGIYSTGSHHRVQQTGRLVRQSINSSEVGREVDGKVRFGEEVGVELEISAAPSLNVVSQRVL